MTAKIRLFVDHPLGAGQPVPLTREQAHYLFSVMRMSTGGKLRLFNGRDGEWLAEISEAGKKGGIALCTEALRPQVMPPDLWLLFAPIKKARTDFIVEKAVELGVARILPVQTHYTNSERIRQDRLQAHAMEAAEQCGALSVPEVAELAKLDTLLADWPAERALVFCDEAEAGGRSAMLDAAPAPAAILIGPEGGFSDIERARLGAMAQTRVIALGPRILRADTAAVAALTLWQTACGDWG
ncbi:16S rRNA (uracil(1498)-N(3))-methyltransferase [Citreicella sp. C3M06]|uniref:16S rRNA (uracil(1498)-N(3))-methyltransferase n=1 Tax=Citreicella sp. C3M06 TaxID=2841564 RepID=UPI001C099AF0|nr:16S rRNA (uracil(1498)-N(3))-methyltransferase [Citreicella sp. C3M06]MBU2963261.1 16S rRNA (uracil(1498)-N(3))-methyltransferase [Citreicella sp. C3M06]